ncbi:MAG: GTPase Era [Clostridia bacterium]|nr:GTPase Era [Clostridia bacterium]
MAFHSGFVAVVGNPNVGKSTLINAIIGKKVSIVSPKPQTTRNKILGVWNTENYQIVFVDTPGMHKGSTKLDDYMQKSIESATEDINLLLYVLDGSKPLLKSDLKKLSDYAKNSYPVFAVVNKVDLTNYERLFPELSKLNEIENLKDVFCISALNNKNLEPLKENIKKYMTDDIKYFLDDQLTDKTTGFMVAEAIREKMLWLLSDEVPHGVGIIIDEMTDKEKFEQITATIYCEKPNHKNIIIGAKGAMLKEIGKSSRLAIEKMLDKKVNLSLWVKVKEDWRNKEGILGNIGYSVDEL